MSDIVIGKAKTQDAGVPAACVSCVSRRQFLASSTLAAVAALLSACGGGGEPGTGTEPVVTGPVTVTIATTTQLATIGRPVKVQGKNVALVRVADGTTAASFIALRLRCSHQGFEPVQVQSTGFHCPNHGSNFNATGDAVSGPALDEQTGPLTRVDFVLNEAAGTITVS